VDTDARATLRVLTLNVLAPANPGWEVRAELLRRTVPALRVDVAAFQEVPVGDGGAFLRELVGHDVHVAVHDAPDDRGVGAALVSRWPLRDVEQVDQVVSQPTWRSRATPPGYLGVGCGGRRGRRLPVGASDPTGR